MDIIEAVIQNLIGRVTLSGGDDLLGSRSAQTLNWRNASFSLAGRFGAPESQLACWS